MKTSLLEYLCCPHCKADLSFYDNSLLCNKCNRVYLIQNGVPIFTDEYLNHKVKLTAQNFAFSWETFFRTDKEFYKRQFFDWISPVTEDHFKGKIVFDAGCGKGRHLLMISPFVKEAIGVDISNSVFIAHNNTKHLPNIHIIKADLNNLPLKDEIFDYIYSIGVVHHTESPKLTTENLFKKLKPDCQLTVWVYGKENNWWIIHLVDPIRKFISAYLHPRIIHFISILLALILFPILKLIYLPVNKIKALHPLQKFLFYYSYLSYICHFDFNEINSIILDHIVAPIAYYLDKNEVKELIDQKSGNTSIEWHNKNSWRVHVKKPNSAVLK